MKATYTTPEQEVVLFEIEDVIATSRGMTNAGDNTSWDQNDSIDVGNLFGKG